MGNIAVIGGIFGAYIINVVFKNYINHPLI